MKNAVMVIVSAMLGVIMLAAVMAVNGRMNRSIELKSNLPSVAEETVENLEETPKYTVGSQEEFAADFISNLSVPLDAKADLQVNFYELDKEKGLLSVGVTEIFSHPNGREGSVSENRTAILEQQEKTETKIFTINFYVEGALYKSCRVAEGDTVTEPVPPLESGFWNWEDANGYLADFSQPVEQDLAYQAVSY